MKTTLWTFVVAAALAGSSAVFGSGSASNKATAVIEFDKPDTFTDFKTRSFVTERDTAELSRELRREVNRLARSILPEGYRVTMRIHDIDMAGDFEPFRQPPLNDVRIVRSMYLPHIKLEYVVADATGNVVASGQRNLSDTTFDMRLRVPRTDLNHLQVETEMIGDLFHEIRHSLS